MSLGPDEDNRDSLFSTGAEEGAAGVGNAADICDAQDTCNAASLGATASRESAPGQDEVLREEEDLDIELGPIEVRKAPLVSCPDAGQVVMLGSPGRPWAVRLWWSAMARIMAQADEHRDCEVVGLLVGAAPRDNRPRTLIWDVAFGRELPASPVEVTMSHEAWQEALDQVSRREDGAGVVGWYHSHPGFGVFLSRADRFIVEHFFGAPGQVSLVYDNKRLEVGAFCRHRGRTREFSGIELALAGEATDLDWRRLRYSVKRGLLRRVTDRLLRPLRMS